MSKITNRIKVAFNTNFQSKWMGGVNYFKNLFLALSLYKEKIIDPIWYYNKETENWISAEFEKLIPCRKKNYLLSNKIIRHFFEFFLNIDSDILLLKKHNINAISHSSTVCNTLGIKKINWIPDFQHLHLPEMFSSEEIKLRNNIYSLIAKNSDLVLLSSNDTYNDFKKMFPDCAEKVRILNFVSYIPPSIYSDDNIFPFGTDIKNNYKKYFYIPNQFWKHKNHLIILKSLNLLKKNGFNEIKIIFSGYIHDYRNRNYYNEIINYINNKNLTENVTFLGLVDDKTVKYLMRNCISVINPSLFEGWSSTVEEAKSIGKNLILSDISVHREQNPPGSIYFSPDNEKELADILLSKWKNSDGGPDFSLEAVARDSMIDRMIDFGKKYEKFLTELF